MAKKTYYVELAGLCGIRPIMRKHPIMHKIMRTHDRIIPPFLSFSINGKLTSYEHDQVFQGLSCSIQLTCRNNCSCIFSTFLDRVLYNSLASVVPQNSCTVFGNNCKLKNTQKQITGTHRMQPKMYCNFSEMILSSCNAHSVCHAS